MHQSEIEISPQHRFEAGYLRPVSRQVQPLMAHIVLAEVQIESQQLGDGESYMGVAMGINREPANRGSALTHDPFDRGTDLATQERQRLVVDYSPLRENGLIEPHAVHPPLWIDPRIVQVLTGIEAHQ